MGIEEQIAQIEARGIEIRLEGEVLKVRGRITQEDDKFFRDNKPAIVQYLRGAGLDAFEQMRGLSKYLGRDVVVDGRAVTLCGLTPLGAIVDTGLLTITVPFGEVSH